MGKVGATLLLFVIRSVGWILRLAPLSALTLLMAHDDQLPVVRTTVVITATTIEPAVDRRDSEIFSRTLFGRDHPLLHVLGAGINAGQHEGGGKSLEIRRFGLKSGSRRSQRRPSRYSAELPRWETCIFKAPAPGSM